jgi:hypothetical protein
VHLCNSETSNEDNGWDFRKVVLARETVLEFTLMEMEKTCLLKVAGAGIMCRVMIPSFLGHKLFEILM